ncbi:leucine export protein LeuE [Vitreoscilla filiformis]|uniref:Leucine export protein LeuE n=1 Tax=Vitreoscilla filiformis TaxID=63 RepID=A0A221KFG6_VITFI|nr:leucine efflux protein LeuE [Vitreoscilla filiformis]ASM77587.1 leucine export protein LeuE [Vitreoscilla filiformis]
MFGITDLGTYVLGVIFIVLLPGPNSLYVLSVAGRRGVRAGYAGACGVFLGDTILMLLTAAGAASLLKAAPALFLVIKSVGAAYLAWVGIQLLRSAWQQWRGTVVASTSEPAADLSQPFRRALLISLLNPKAILFFLSFFVQFVDPAYAYPAVTFLALGAIVQFFSAVYLSVLILAGARLAAAFRAHRRAASVTSGSVGTLFLGFGAKLATASLG